MSLLLIIIYKDKPGLIQDLGMRTRYLDLEVSDQRLLFLYFCLLIFLGLDLFLLLREQSCQALVQLHHGVIVYIIITAVVFLCGLSKATRTIICTSAQTVLITILHWTRTRHKVKGQSTRNQIYVDCLVLEIRHTLEPV